MTDTPPKTHQQVRFEHAGTLAKQISELKTVDEKRDFLENVLLTGEKRGLMGAVEFLKYRVGILRARHADGVANHVAQGVKDLHDWALMSENFQLFERPEGTDNKVEPRKFFGQPKEEEKAQ